MLSPADDPNAEEELDDHFQMILYQREAQSLKHRLGMSLLCTWFGGLQPFITSCVAVQ